MEAKLGIKEKISFFVQAYLEVLTANPFVPAFVINTLNSNPSRFLVHIKKAGLNPLLFQQQLDSEAARGTIRPIKAEHLIVNIVSMCVFPIVAKPIIQNIFEMNDDKYQQYMAEREAQIVEFVLKSISL